MPRKSAPKGSKKAAKKATARRSGEKKPKRRKIESYTIYIYKLLKEVHPDMSISSKAMLIMDSFVKDMFQRIAAEASSLAHIANRTIIRSNDIESAVCLLLPAQLAKYAVSEGTKAMTKYAADSDCSIEKVITVYLAHQQARDQLSHTKRRLNQHNSFM